MLLSECINVVFIEVTDYGAAAGVVVVGNVGDCGRDLSATVAKPDKYI